jgi:hypothetical protein
MLAPNSVTLVDTLDLTVAPWDWPFLSQRRVGIDTHFAEQQRAKPAMWNGRILMMRAPVLAGRHFTAHYFETEFAGLLAWSAWGWPDEAVFNGFGQGAILSADGAFIMGVMGDHTANAGKIYFPSGTPDRNDVSAGKLDMAGSIARELREETGLVWAEMDEQPSWHLVRDRQRLAYLRVLKAHDSAETLRARILAHLAADPEPELKDVRIVRGEADIDPMMPGFIPLFLRNWWGA